VLWYREDPSAFRHCPSAQLNSRECGVEAPAAKTLNVEEDSWVNDETTHQHRTYRKPNAVCRNGVAFLEPESRWIKHAGGFNPQPQPRVRATPSRSDLS